MILVVAANPSIDRSRPVPVLRVGQVHRPTRVFLGAGGKGLNVARAARVLGLGARVTGCLAGHTGALVADLAREEGLDARWHLLPLGETRTCVLLNHDQGDSTVLNEPGPHLDPADWLAFHRLVEELAGGVRAVVLAGSVPPSVDPEAYAALCRALVRRVGRVYVDTPGPPLAALVRNPVGLAIKVNRAELAEALGQPLEEPGRLVAALRALLGAGAAMVGVTLGAQGAVVATADGAWRGTSLAGPLVSSVGSGDSFLAGLVAAEVAGLPLTEGLRLACACGAANAETPLPGRFEADRVAALRAGATVERLG